MSTDLENITIIEKQIGITFKRYLGYSFFRSDANEIYRLEGGKNVIWLNLRNRGLSDISFLELLPNLTQINLSGNSIADISILKSLPNLIKLYLNSNKISDISVLKYLPNLSKLYLSYNNITDISVLDNLKKLWSVNLNSNKISELPKGLLSLKLEIKYEKGYEFPDNAITIYDNPIQNPPLEIIKKGNAAIEIYFNYLEKQGKKALTEVNVLSVGDGDSNNNSEVIERVDKIETDSEAKFISDEELIKRIKQSDKVAKTTQVTTTVYERNEYVSEFAKRKAKGFCQLCENFAPFNDSKSKPYLESHHVIWLSRGGDDSVENVIALCPNCHAKIHELDIESDVEKLKRKAMENSRV